MSRHFVKRLKNRARGAVWVALMFGVFLLPGCATGSQTRACCAAAEREAAVAGIAGWVDQDIEAGTVSGPISIVDRARPMLHLAHRGAAPVALKVEVDRGDGDWQLAEQIELPAEAWGLMLFQADAPFERVRVVANDRVSQATVWLSYVEDADRAKALMPRVIKPWSEAMIRAGAASAEVPMLAHQTRYFVVATDTPAEVTIQLDVSGTGSWHTMGSLITSPDEPRRFNFIPSFNPRQVRLVSDTDATMTATFVYE